MLRKILDSAPNSLKEVKRILSGGAAPIFGMRLKAFIVLKLGEVTTKEALISWLKSRVARYQLPAEISFLEELPLSSIGKVKRSQLK